MDEREIYEDSRQAHEQQTQAQFNLSQALNRLSEENNNRTNDWDNNPNLEFNDFFTNPQNLEDFNSGLNYQEVNQPEYVWDGLENIADYSQDHQQPTFDDQSDKVNPLGAFLTQKIAELSENNPENKTYTLSDSFSKNQQSQWFSEYNKNQMSQGKTENLVFCKPNGHFYLENESIETALRNNGLSPEQAKDNAQFYDLAFMGKTQSKKKNNPNDVGFNTYALALKDPMHPESLGIIGKLLEARNDLVASVISNSPTVESATSLMLGKVGDFVKEHMANKNTNKEPFIGVGENVFMDSSAVRIALNKIPELKGNYTLTKLDASGNSTPYVGSANQLDSYFESKLSIYELKTKDESKLPQEKLERIVTKLIEDNPDLRFNSTPVEGMSLRDPAVEEQKELDRQKKGVSELDNQPKAEQPLTKNQADQPVNKQQSQTGQKKQQSQSEDEQLDVKQKPKEKPQRTTILESVAKATATLAKNTLKLLLELAKRILQLLLALVLVALGQADKAKAMFSNVVKPVQFNNRTQKSNDATASNQAQDAKELAKKEANEKFKKALEDIKPNKTNDANKAKELADGGLVANHVNNLNGFEQKSLLKKAVKQTEQMSPDEKQNLLSQVEVPSLHKGLKDTPLPPLMKFDDQHGLLLSKNDLVKTQNGEHYGVLDAQTVNGQLYYTLASENENGHYDLSFKKASDLELVGYNAVNFDNDLNLKNQAKDFTNTLSQKYGEDLIKPVELFDYQNPKDAITPKQLAEKINLVPVDTLLSSDIVKGATQINLTNHKYDDVRKNHNIHLHKDSASDLTPNENKRNHPYFGELLGVNDAVKITNPDGTEAKASVLRAYESNGDLHYIVKNGNDNQSVPAKDLELVGHNKGTLSETEIADAKNEQNEKIAPTDLPLNHENSNHINLDTVGDKLKKGMGTALGVLATASVANSILSQTDPNTGDVKYYATVGQSEKNPNRYLGLEVEKNSLGDFVPKPFDQLSFTELNKRNFDITAVGDVENPDIQAQIDKALPTYNQAVTNGLQSLDTAIQQNETKDAMDLKDQNLATEYALTNLKALSLINEQANQVDKTPDQQFTFGRTANLAETTAYLGEIEQAVQQASQDKANEVANNIPISSLSSVSNMITNNNEQNPTPTENVTFQGVPLDQLKLVRVVKGLDNISIDGDTARFDRFAQNDDTIRNTTHFTLNGVVSDHAYGKFSESKYAIIADFQETVQEKNNKIHGLSPADTYFWSDDLSLKAPTIVMPENDPNIEKFSQNFNVLQYKPSDDVAENYANLNKAIEQHFDKENLPFNTINQWNWNGYNQISQEEQLSVSNALGFETPLPTRHDQSVDSNFENINSRIVVASELLSETKDQAEFKENQFGEKIDFIKQDLSEALDQVKKNFPHATEYYEILKDKFDNFVDKYSEKVNFFFPENEAEKVQTNIISSMPDKDFSNLDQVLNQLHPQQSFQMPEPLPVDANTPMPPPVPQQSFQMPEPLPIDANTPMPPPVPQAHVTVEAKAPAHEELSATAINDPEINKVKLFDSFNEQVVLAVKEENQNAKYMQTALGFISNGQHQGQHSASVNNSYSIIDSYREDLNEQVIELKQLVQPFIIDPNKQDFLNPNNIKDFDGLKNELNNSQSDIVLTIDSLRDGLITQHQSIKEEMQVTANGFAELHSNVNPDPLTVEISKLVEEKLNRLPLGYETIESLVDNTSQLSNSATLDDYKSNSLNASSSFEDKPTVSISLGDQQNRNPSVDRSYNNSTPSI